MEKVFEEGDKLDVARAAFGLKKHTTQEKHEFGSATETKILDQSEHHEGRLKVYRLKRELIETQFDDLRSVNTKKRRFFRSNEKKHQEFAPGERRTEKITNHVEQTFSYFVNEDGSDLATHHEPGSSGVGNTSGDRAADRTLPAKRSGEWERTEHDRRRLRIETKEKLDTSFKPKQTGHKN